MGESHNFGSKWEGLRQPFSQPAVASDIQLKRVVVLLLLVPSASEFLLKALNVGQEKIEIKAAVRDLADGHLLNKGLI